MPINITREFVQQLDENHPEQKWASAFIDLLPEMKKVKKKAVEHLANYKDRYMIIHL